MMRLKVRRSLLGVALAFGLSASPLGAADRTPPPKAEEAVDRAPAFIAKQQRPEGLFDHEVKKEAGDIDSSMHRRAITGLCLLAFLSAGHTPDVGRYGPVVRKAIDGLIASVPDDGYVGRLDDKPMYSQAIVTLALTQAYGVEPVAEKRLREYAVLKRLTGVILAAQDVKKDASSAGGWRYTREAPDSDLSLSGWNALALRAAQDAGIPVPAGSLKRAADYVAGCYSKEARGFAYQPGGAVQAGTTATGVLCLYLLEHDVRPEAREAAKTLAERPLDDKNANGGYPYYAMFYVAQAASQTADDTIWKPTVKITLDRLTKTQDPDGGWPKTSPPESQEPGRVYRAALATLTLTVPYRILPIYQR